MKQFERRLLARKELLINRADVLRTEMHQDLRAVLAHRLLSASPSGKLKKSLLYAGCGVSLIAAVLLIRKPAYALKASRVLLKFWPMAASALAFVRSAKHFETR